MAKVNGNIYASNWCIKCEELVKNSTLSELKKFIINNSEIEEDDDEITTFIPVGEKNFVKGKTYEITDNDFNHEEFVITDDGRVFLMLSLINRVEIVENEMDNHKSNPYLSISGLTNTIYIVDGKEKYDVTNHAIEMVEVLKQPIIGHWIKIKDGVVFHNMDYECSICGNTLDFSGVNCGRGNANYCPNCGKKMKCIEKE